MVNLLNFDLQDLSAYCEQLGEKRFRARQLLRWIHAHGVQNFSQMEDLSKALRQKLQATAQCSAPAIISDQVASDGTRKWLLDCGQGAAIEMVFIPEVNRATLCISSQAGCAVNCYFCATGAQGFARNLTTSEIIGQLWLAEHLLRTSFGKRVITNVVFMGMGEPLLNFEAVVRSVNIMLSDYAYGLSRRRVTLSTSGVVPMIDRLAHTAPVALAVSLHASHDALRDFLVPLNKKYPLAELLAACQRYLAFSPRQSITFEYCMLDAINDSLDDAKNLAQLLANIPCKVNLIPFNPFPGSELRSSTSECIRSFAKILQDRGIVTTVRKTRGEKILAACGQLAGEVINRTSLKPRQNLVHFAQRTVPKSVPPMISY